MITYNKALIKADERTMFVDAEHCDKEAIAFRVMLGKTEDRGWQSLYFQCQDKDCRKVFILTKLLGV